jgi:hypothetical protein
LELVAEDDVVILLGRERTAFSPKNISEALDALTAHVGTVSTILGSTGDSLNDTIAYIDQYSSSMRQSADAAAAALANEANVRQLGVSKLSSDLIQLTSRVATEESTRLSSYSTLLGEKTTPNTLAYATNTLAIHAGNITTLATSTQSINTALTSLTSRYNADISTLNSNIADVNSRMLSSVTSLASSLSTTTSVGGGVLWVKGASARARERGVCVCVCLCVSVC